MKRNILELYYNYEAINESINFIAPLIIERKNKLKRKLDDTKQFYDIVKKISDVIREFNPTDELNENEIKEINIKITNKLLDLGLATINENNEFTFNIKEDIEPVKNIDEVIDSLRASNRNKRFLFNNAVVNCVTSYEQFVGFLFKSFYFQNSNCVCKKALTFEELKEIGSVEEAKNYLINREIKDLMYGSIDDWQKHFKNNIKIKINHYESNIKEINEIFLRRNLIVHNSSIVNSIYLKEIGNSDYKIDDPIESSTEYINNVQKLLFVNAFYLGIFCIDKMGYSKDEKLEIANTFSFIAFNMMKNGKWEQAKIIYSVIKEFELFSKEMKEMHNINYLLCRVNLNEDNIYEEIEKIDFSDKSNFLKMGYFALMLKKDELIETIKLMGTDVRTDMINEWPVFFRVREDKNYYNKVIKVINQKHDENKDLIKINLGGNKS